MVTQTQDTRREERRTPRSSFAVLQAVVAVPSHAPAATPPRNGEPTLRVATITTCCAAAQLARPGDRGTGANDDHRRESRSMHR